MDGLHPVLDLQLGNLTEVPGLISASQIQVIQNLAAGFQVSVKIATFSTGCFIKRKHQPRRKQAVQAFMLAV